MAFRQLLVAVAVAAFGLCTSVLAQDSTSNVRVNHVAGEKLDSELGRLPHYQYWPAAWKIEGLAPHKMARLNPVYGEKLDSGLGELSTDRSRDKPLTSNAIHHR